MTITEASQYLPTGIKRRKWYGHIKSLDTGEIVFVRTGGLLETWYPYQQDIGAVDWEMVSK